MAYTSVDVFGLMSGYLGLYKKRASCYRVLELICVVLFYCVCITLIFRIVFPERVFGIKELLKGLFPQIAGRYWYITCYIPIAFLQPYINKVILHLDKQEHLKLCIVIITMFGLLQSFINLDLFVFKQGYSFVWLLSLYIVGAYIKRVNLFKYVGNIKSKSIAVFIASSLVLLFGNIIIAVVMHKNAFYFIEYTSPIIVLMSICILILFRDMKIKKCHKVLSLLSFVTFDVYLLHCHILIYDYYITSHFKWIADLNVFLIPIAILGCAIAIFAVASIIGIMRSNAFRITKFDRLIKSLSVKVDKLLYVIKG